MQVGAHPRSDRLHAELDGGEHAAKLRREREKQKEVNMSELPMFSGGERVHFLCVLLRRFKGEWRTRTAVT